MALMAILPLSAAAQTEVLDKKIQIKMALLAAPEEKREGAMVYGYDASGKLLVLREGTNEMICMADDPARKGLNVSCYHRDMEPMMQRGRELRASGKTLEQIDSIRAAEVKSGVLAINTQPSTLFVFSATEENCNWKDGTVQNGYLRSVVYIPFATPESTGLPLKESAPGLPWIMNPGTYKAHIMINPPRAANN